MEKTNGPLHARRDGLGGKWQGFLIQGVARPARVEQQHREPCYSMDGCIAHLRGVASCREGCFQQRSVLYHLPKEAQGSKGTTQMFPVVGAGPGPRPVYGTAVVSVTDDQVKYEGPTNDSPVKQFEWLSLEGVRVKALNKGGGKSLALGPLVHEELPPAFVATRNLRARNPRLHVQGSTCFLYGRVYRAANAERQMQEPGVWRAGDVIATLPAESRPSSVRTYVVVASQALAWPGPEDQQRSFGEFGGFGGPHRAPNWREPVFGFGIGGLEDDHFGPPGPAVGGLDRTAVGPPAPAVVAVTVVVVVAAAVVVVFFTKPAAIISPIPLEPPVPTACRHRVVIADNVGIATVAAAKRSRSSITRCCDCIPLFLLRRKWPPGSNQELTCFDCLWV